MTKPNKWIITAVLLGVIGVVLAIAIWPRQTDDNVASSINFRLKWVWYAGWAGELLASDEQLWAEHGLVVDTRPGGFELDPIRLVVSGDDHIGVAGADQILLARMNGVPLVAFAVQYQVSPVGFVAMEESGITTVESFAGHRIGVKHGTDVDPVYRALLSEAGLTKDDLTEVPVRFDLAPFYSGAIDVYPGYLTNDLLLPAEQGFGVNTISAQAEGVSVYGNVYFCREDYLRDHVEQVTAFLAALDEAWHAALSGSPDRIADLALEKNNGLNRDHEIRVVESLKPFVLPEGTNFGQMTGEGWKHLYTLLRTQGVLDRDFDYESAFTLQVLDRLAEQDDG